jgi:hypothetical protein
MLDVDNGAAFLLQRGLIEPDWIVGGALTIRSVARRNRNLLIHGPAGAGYLIKQPDDPSDGGYVTLSAERNFYELCQPPEGEALLDGILPRLADCDAEGSVLVLELVRGAEPLGPFDDREPGAEERVAEVGRALGQALGAVHRTFRQACLSDDPRLAWLPRREPWVMMVHRPSPGLLASLSPANHQTLRILQREEGLGMQLDGLRGRWRPETVIHGDVKLDNVLVRPPGDHQAGSAATAWLVDWELVQVGDPAWDLAGALQDFVRFWASSMPVASAGAAEEMIAGARYPLAALRATSRALWNSYRTSAGLASSDADDLLSRAVAFSGARLIQSAYEILSESARLSSHAVILLQISANLLADPGRGQIHLYGIPRGSPLR